MGGFARGPTAIKLEACEGCEVVSNAYNVVCELTSRHTAASSTLSGQIFVLVHLKLRFRNSLFLSWFAAGDGVALLFGLVLNNSFGNLAGIVFKFLGGFRSLIASSCRCWELMLGVKIPK